tara:strand:+ start:258 stop:875 length:618 start_codon:yes stop_codon:yes gene_type:complete
MIHKKKKCKGIGKAKDYPACGKLTFYRKNGLCTDGGKSCNASFLLNSIHGGKLVDNTITKVTKPRIDLEIAKTEKKERSSLSALKKGVEEICHLYIRTRDKGKNCISCNGYYKSNFQAGHFYSAGKYSNIKFNEFNINGQCEQCNLRMEGNVNGYRTILPNRIGADKVRELDQLARDYKINGFSWDRLVLVELKEYYKKKLKEIS